MQVTYIHHSSFLVEMDSAYLLFDYFEGMLPLMKPEKPLFVFASHRHGDHFSPIIFEFAERHPNIHFFLSDDIWRKRVPASLLEVTTFCPPHQEFTLGNLTVETLRSTDEGVAFWIQLDGKSIYHAGDLNDWFWASEGDAWNTSVHAAYCAEIDRLQGRAADLAFVPLDPRLETGYHLGMDYFLSRVTAVNIFPMHCWNDFSVIERYRKAHPHLPLHSITARGDTYFI